MDTNRHIPEFPVFHSRVLFKCENSALSMLSAGPVNQLESKKKWQSPLKLFARNQSTAKIS